VTINTVLGIKFVYSKDQMDMSFVWIEVRPRVSNLGHQIDKRENMSMDGPCNLA